MIKEEPQNYINHNDRVANTTVKGEKNLIWGILLPVIATCLVSLNNIIVLGYLIPNHIQSSWWTPFLLFFIWISAPAGCILFGLGCSRYAKEKGYWGGLGWILGFLFSILGLIILAILPNRNQYGRPKEILTRRVIIFFASLIAFLVAAISFVVYQTNQLSNIQASQNTVSKNDTKYIADGNPASVPSGWITYHDPRVGFDFSLQYPPYYTDNIVRTDSDTQSFVYFFDKHDHDNYIKTKKDGTYSSRYLIMEVDHNTYMPEYRDPDQIENVIQYPDIKVGNLVFKGMSYELVGGWYENPSKPGIMYSNRTSPEDKYTETLRQSEMTFLATDERNTYMFLYLNFDSIEPGHKATTDMEKQQVKQRIADLQKMVASLIPIKIVR